MNTDARLEQVTARQATDTSGYAAATLTTFGWLAWADAVALLGDVEGVWLAPGGIVRKSAREPWPAALPVTTRIHGWSPGSTGLWRLTPRAVDGTVLVTRLDRSPRAAGADEKEPAAPTDPGISPASRLVATTTTVDRDWERVWVTGTAPTMFLRSTEGGH